MVVSFEWCNKQGQQSLVVELFIINSKIINEFPPGLKPFFTCILINQLENIPDIKLTFMTACKHFKKSCFDTVYPKTTEIPHSFIFPHIYLLDFVESYEFIF